MRALAEIMGKKIELETVPPFRGLSQKIPGAYWSAKKGRWTLPLEMSLCRNLREVFAADLEIGPKLWEWAKAETALEQTQRALGKSLAGVSLPRVEAEFPRLAQSLRSRPYQTNAARFIVEGRNVLVADTPGLGKTTETIAGVMESGVPGPYLVVAPAAAITDAWEREIVARLGGAASVHSIIGSKAKRTALLDAGLKTSATHHNTWIVVNIEMIRTKAWWVCPACEKEYQEEEAAYPQLRAEYEALLEQYEFLHESWKLLGGNEPEEPLEPAPVGKPDYRWEASDRPKSAIVDCGHNPTNVRTDVEHAYSALFGVEWGAIIMDECQRSLLRNSGKPTQTRFGAKMLETKPDGLRIPLSGTPMRGKPQRLWGVLNWMEPKKFGGYWAWLERFWEVNETGYQGAKQVGNFREERAGDFATMLDRYMIRRTKAEVSPDLPAKAYMGTPIRPEAPEGPNNPVAVWLPLTPQQTTAYGEMLGRGMALLEGGTLNAVGALAELTRLKQLASAYGRIEVDGDTTHFHPALPSNKWNWLENWLRERNLLGAEDRDEAPDSKVIIVSQFTSLLRLIANELRGQGAVISVVTGDITGANRQRMVDRFNDPASGVNIMLLNTLAGGVALTLDAADDMVFLDETHVPDDQEQAEGRNDNRRPEERVATRRYWYLKSLDTVDHAIAITNLHRDADQKHHLDGRRGVEYAREVFSTMKDLWERRTK